MDGGASEGGAAVRLADCDGTDSTWDGAVVKVDASKVFVSTGDTIFEADRLLRKFIGDNDLIISLTRLFGDVCEFLVSTGMDIATGLLGIDIATGLVGLEEEDGCVFDFPS